MAETRARRRIRAAIESRGYHIESIEWEPVYYAGEMSGMAGGWTVLIDRPYLPNTWPGNDLGWFDVEGVLAQVDYWLKPEGACACDRTHDPLTAARLKGDPKKPTHGHECDFHIPYCLRWWKD